MLKVDYLKNEKCFWSEIKSIFPFFESALFRHTKQTSKNVADTTFKYPKCFFDPRGAILANGRYVYLAEKHSALFESKITMEGFILVHF